MSSGYPPAPPPTGEYGYGTRPPPPPNHLVMAIVTTVLCCLPFGIVSLVYANQVNTKVQVGDYAGALESSKKAKTWWIVSIVAFVVVVAIYIAVVAAGVVAFDESDSF